MVFLLHLRSCVLVTVCPCAVVCSGQYDVGASIGVYHDELNGRKSKGHEYARFENIPAANLVASVFYRERSTARTDLGLELQFVRRSFSLYASEGSLAGSTVLDVDVTLYLMYLNITPEIKLNSKGSVRFRFGPQFGFKLGGFMNGQERVSYPFNYTTNPLFSATPANFKGDIRFLAGIGFQSNASAKWAVTFDPYLSVGIGSILKNDPGSNGHDFGMKIGVSRHVVRGTLLQWFDKKMPMPEDGPNW